MAHVYHWKHGWIPLDHAAALSKAKGNHDQAATLLAAAHGSHAGIHSRRDVASAALALPSVPSGERDRARTDVQLAAVEHGAVDLLPRSMRGTAHAVQTAQERHRRLESQPVTAKVQVRQGIYRGDTGHHITGRDSRGRRVAVFVPGSRSEADRVAANIRTGKPAFAH